MGLQPAVEAADEEAARSDHVHLQHLLLQYAFQKQQAMRRLLPSLRMLSPRLHASVQPLQGGLAHAAHGKTRHALKRRTEKSIRTSSS